MLFPPSVSGFNVEAVRYICNTLYLICIFRNVFFKFMFLSFSEVHVCMCVWAGDKRDCEEQEAGSSEGKNGDNLLSAFVNSNLRQII